MTIDTEAQKKGGVEVQKQHVPLENQSFQFLLFVYRYEEGDGKKVHSWTYSRGGKDVYCVFMVEGTYYYVVSECDEKSFRHCTNLADVIEAIADLEYIHGCNNRFITF